MVKHLLSNKCYDCCSTHGSTNVEPCIMCCWMLKYAIQHVESCWTLLNKRAWLYSVQQVATYCHLLNDVSQPFFEFRSNMARWRLGRVQHCGRPFFGWWLSFCLHLLAWQMITCVSNWGSSFQDDAKNISVDNTLTFCLSSSNRAGCIDNAPKEVLFFIATSSSNFSVFLFCTTPTLAAQSDSNISLSAMFKISSCCSTKVEWVFNKSQPRSTFVAQQKLNAVEPCIIGLTIE